MINLPLTLTGDYVETQHTFNVTAITAGVLLLVMGLSGCGELQTQKDAQEPTTANIIEGNYTQVIKMPEGFRNVTATQYKSPNGKCYMIFVTSRGWNQDSTKDFPSLPSGIAVVPC